MSERTNLYLLGHPVGHSKSPAMYNALYGELGLPWRYGLADCETEEEARALLDARAFLSLNITTPYKPLAFEAADVKAASARLAGGANVLVALKGKLVGYNVDGEGCVGYLRRAGVAFDGAQVAVCGTGPTALAILHACAIAGAARVLLLSRDRARSQEVVNGYLAEYHRLANATIALPAAREGERAFREALEQTRFQFGSYATSTQAIAASDVVVNATPLGMNAGDPSPFDTALLHEGQTVFDCVYGHGETALLAGARAAGCAAHDGAGMLVAQAVATARILFDLEGVECARSDDELFALMARAAGFEGLA